MKLRIRNLCACLLGEMAQAVGQDKLETGCVLEVQPGGPVMFGGKKIGVAEVPSDFKGAFAKLDMLAQHGLAAYFLRCQIGIGTGFSDLLIHGNRLELVHPIRRFSIAMEPDDVWQETTLVVVPSGLGAINVAAA